MFLSPQIFIARISIKQHAFLIDTEYRDTPQEYSPKDLSFSLSLFLLFPFSLSPSKTYFPVEKRRRETRL